MRNFFRISAVHPERGEVQIAAHKKGEKDAKFADGTRIPIKDEAGNIINKDQWVNLDDPTGGHNVTVLDD